MRHQWADGTALPPGPTALSHCARTGGLPAPSVRVESERDRPLRCPASRRHESPRAPFYRSRGMRLAAIRYCAVGVIAASGRTGVTPKPPLVVSWRSVGANAVGIKARASSTDGRAAPPRGHLTHRLVAWLVGRLPFGRAVCTNGVRVAYPADRSPITDAIACARRVHHFSQLADPGLLRARTRARNSGTCRRSRGPPCAHLPWVLF
jgi:hypothetical protein